MHAIAFILNVENNFIHKIFKSGPDMADSTGIAKSAFAIQTEFPVCRKLVESGLHTEKLGENV
jgi:hypothetical protein